MNIAGVGPTMIPEEVAKRCSMMSLTFGKKYGKTFCWVYFITYLTSASSSQPGECACPDLEKEDGGWRMEDGGWRIRLCIYTSKSFSFLPPFHSIEISKEDTRPGLIANERAFNILYDGIRNGKPFVLYVRKKAKATLR